MPPLVVSVTFHLSIFVIPVDCAIVSAVSTVHASAEIMFAGASGHGRSQPVERFFPPGRAAQPARIGFPSRETSRRGGSIIPVRATTLGTICPEAL